MAQPDLSAIQVFVETARHLSFTGAAQALGLTRSAAGKSVSRLEARLGVTLIHRSTRRLVLTPDGEAYLAVARRALDEIGAAEAALSSSNRTIAGRLRVDAPAAWGRRVLLPILADVVQAHPGLNLSLSFTDRIIDPVEEQVDLVVRFGETPDTTGLITRKLADQRVLVGQQQDRRAAGVHVVEQRARAGAGLRKQRGGAVAGRDRAGALCGVRRRAASTAWSTNVCSA